MRIDISGKGGVGKTTIASYLIRTLNRKGYRMLAIDADTDPNLPLSLGVSVQEMANMPALSEGTVNFAQTKTGLSQLVERYAYRTSDGVPILVMGKVNRADSGCMCRSYTSVKNILSVLGYRKDLITIVDLNAGLEYLSRSSIRSVDILLIIAEPYFRSMETIPRIVKMAKPLNISHIYAIANKVRDQQDEQAMQDYLQKFDIEILAALPFDHHLRGQDIPDGALWQKGEKALTKLVSRLESEFRTQQMYELVFSLSEKFLLSGRMELNQREVLAIRYLGQQEKLTMSELAKALRAAYSTTTSIVDKLSARKYVERIRSNADRRVIFVRLTETGEMILKEHIAAYEQLVRQMARNLDDREEQTLISLIRKTISA